MINDDQKEFWSNSAGPIWVVLQPEMDALMQPVLDLVLDAAELRNGDAVADIGCGTGIGVAQAADRVGPDGHVTGIDISHVMLDLARNRLADRPNTTLVHGDAQTHGFDAGRLDRIISRFGVMFFEDSVAAFANMATALKSGGTLTMAAWGLAPKNPFFMEPAAAAAALLGPMPKVDRTLPGPFALERLDVVRTMLGRAGLVDISAREVHLDLTPNGDLRAVGDLCCRIGPADSALQYHDGTAQDRKALSEAIALSFAAYEGAEGVRIPACINLYQARKSA